MQLPELRPIEWRGDAERGALFLLDQRLLPEREEWIRVGSVAEAAVAIRDMTVRGAPAIGISAAYALVLAAQEAARQSPSQAAQHLDSARTALAATRPTAVNLFWALERMWGPEKDASPRALLAKAQAIHEEDVAGNLRMAKAGAARIEPGMGVLTHCNAGALATGGVGTALGVIREAHAQGKRIHVFVDETRPRLQGARLTAWELARLDVPYTLLCDSAAASTMRQGRIQFCVTGADRIARNGDTANKIGTYSVAVNAQHHRIPFHVAAPRSTFDLGIADGSEIPIEVRDAAEVTIWGKEHVFNPAFDVTPAALIRSFFTDVGEVDPTLPAIQTKLRS
jgi:methylthioribose-1-phosphate isomerase